MVTKKLSLYTPIKGVNPFNRKEYCSCGYGRITKYEIELCCNCSEKKCNGEPCEKLKQAHKEAREIKKR